MAIKITVGSKQPPEPSKPDPIAEIELQIRRTANGNYFISDHADIDIIVMKDGIAVEAGPADNILKQPQNAYTKTLLDAAL